MSRSLRITAAALITALCLCADGGPVLLHKRAGAFIVTVFGTPRVGTSDLSVFVQNAPDRSTVLDADVDLRVADVSIRATHESATNKLLYAAAVKLNHAGKERLEVTIRRAAATDVAEGDIMIAAASSPIVAYWPYFALIPAVILLFALNQWLKSKRRVRRLEARP